MIQEHLPFELTLKIIDLGFNRKTFLSYYRLLEHKYEDFRSGDTIIFNKDNPIIILSNTSQDEHTKFICYAPIWQQAIDFLLGLLKTDVSEYFVMCGVDSYSLIKQNRIVFSEPEMITVFKGDKIQCVEELIKLVL